ASGAPTFDNYEVYPIIIDYDDKNKDKKRTVDLLKNYAEVHDAAFMRHSQTSNLMGQAHQFFAAKLRDIVNNYVFPFIQAGENIKFRNYVGYDSLSGDTLMTKTLLESLYDKSNRADTELNLNMDVGFKGNPNIGSVVFHAINITEKFGDFLTLFNPDAGDKVVVIGSLFGGTGAAGIPEIVKAIYPKSNGRNTATILVLPYFAPKDNNDPDRAIKAYRFNSKTKAALNFYKDSELMNKIDKIYYVGDPYPTVVPYSEGGDTQINNANIVELIASMMIEHYVADRDPVMKEFKFSPDANIIVTPGDQNAQRLFIKDFDNISISYVLLPMVRLAIALKFFHDEIYSKKARERSFFKYLGLENAVVPNATGGNNKLRVLCNALEQFYHKYQSWLKELDFDGNDEVPMNSHRLGICDMTRRSFTDIILKEVRNGVSREVPTFVQRLGQIMGSSNNNTLGTNNLLTFMDRYFDSHYDNTKNALKVGHEPEWTFADILYLSSKEGLDKLSTN
ncbi:MAG: hypothetical protein LUC91_03820, partial [Prevotella sp.]|nr:hypothetical protein [Prevotella sp.]